MTYDYAFVLVLLVAATGSAWLVDALRRALRRRPVAAATGEYRAAPPRSVVVDYARSFFPVLLAILSIRTCVAEPFQIPSGSMMPTLLTGDYILVDKYSYGVRLPVVNTKVLEVGAPQRGEIVVFRPPWAPGETWIKRVVGLPGDEVRYQGKRLWINGEEIVAREVGPYTGPTEPGHAPRRAEVRHERLGAAEHDLLQIPAERFGREGTWIVPAGEYFLMGDNRDNSEDGRYHGFVPEATLVGRARLIWMSYDRSVDLRRIGTVLR